MKVSDQYAKFFDLERIIKMVSKYQKNFDVNRFMKAFEFAEKAHSGQMRKDKVTPYIVHPVKVVEELLTLHADEDVLISALLHDVPEDTTATIEDVETNFGVNVAFLVDGITKLSKVQYQNNMVERDIESLKKLFLHTAKDPRVIIIKLADRLHNMKTLDFLPPEKQVRIAKETLEIYVPIANLLGIDALKDQLEDLCFRYIYPTEYKQLAKSLCKLNSHFDNLTKKTITAISHELANNNISGQVFARREKLYALYKKIISLGRKIEDVDRWIRVSVVVENQNDCYVALGLIHKNYTPKIERFRDYIANPKTNGYQAIHTLVFGIEGEPTEVHIATKQMYFDDSYGIAAHFFEIDAGQYKGKDSFLDSDKRSKWVNEVINLEKIDRTTEFLENLKSDILQDRISVFTPKGQIVDLPKQSSAIDFAYAIHSEVGDQAKKAKVNGEIKPITTILQINDTVEIITSKDATPSIFWLNYAKTSNAKNRIRHFFKQVSHQKCVHVGLNLFQKELDIRGFGVWETIDFGLIKKALLVLNNQEFEKWEDVFIAIGAGEISALELVDSLSRDKKYEKLNDEIQKNRILRPDKKPGIDVKLKIVAKNRFGLMRDITNIIYKNAVDIDFFQGKAANIFPYSYFSSQFTVENVGKISQIFSELEQIEDVFFYVHRIISRGVLTLYFVLFVTIAAWIIHPFLVQRFLSAGLSGGKIIVFETITYVAFVALLGSLLVIMNLVKKYYPMLRRQKFFWTASFLILSLASLFLMIEIFYQKLTLNWLILGGLCLSLYGYLGINYYNAKKNRF